MLLILLYHLPDWANELIVLVGQGVIFVEPWKVLVVGFCDLWNRAGLAVSNLYSTLSQLAAGFSYICTMCKLLRVASIYSSNPWQDECIVWFQLFLFQHHNAPVPLFFGVSWERTLLASLWTHSDDIEIIGAWASTAVKSGMTPHTSFMSETKEGLVRYSKLQFPL